MSSAWAIRSARELVDGGEKLCFHAQRRGSFDVLLAIVDEECLLGMGPKFFESIAINCRIGFGHAQLIAPHKHVKTRKPFDLAFHGLLCGVANVGEDGGEKSAGLERTLPREHGWIQRHPHARVPTISSSTAEGDSVSPA